MTVLLVVAKAPLARQAKTRLCPPATPRQAADIAAAALLDTLDAVRDTPHVTPVLAYAGRWGDAERAGDIRAALAGWRLIPQRGGSFAERLSYAYADTAAFATDRPVLQIGMDTPQVRPELLSAAVRRLATADAVLGPAKDGGWWALGLREPRHAVALLDVPMSTADTGRLTRSALAARGLSVTLLPTLSDVDTWSDAVTVAGAAPGGRFASTVTHVRHTVAGSPTAPAGATRAM